MPDPDDWSREVDKALFDDVADEAPRAPTAEVADVPPPNLSPQPAVPPATVDAALFGDAEPDSSWPTTAPEPGVPIDVSAPTEVEILPRDAPPHPGPAIEAIIVYDEEADTVFADDHVQDVFDEHVDGGAGGARFEDRDDLVVPFYDDHVGVEDEFSTDRAAAEPDGPLGPSEKRGSGRVWVLAVAAVAVVIGGAVGAVALTRSGGQQPAVDTGKQTTTTPATTAATTTTTPPTTTLPPPSSAAPSSSSPPRPAATTAPRSTRAPAPAPTDPPAPAPAPPPPPPPSEPPPSSSQPPSSSPLPPLP